MTLFQRKFVNEVRRCDDMERRLRYLRREIAKDGTFMEPDEEGQETETPHSRELNRLEVILYFFIISLILEKKYQKCLL